MKINCLHPEAQFLMLKLSFTLQGRRRFLESGTAIERRRRSPSVEGTSGGRAREGVSPPLVRGFGDLTHDENFVIKDD